MVLLCGIQSEAPLARVAEELGRLGVPFVMFNQRRFATTGLQFEVRSGRISGLLRQEGRTCRLEDFRGVFLRLMDDTKLPELEKEPSDSHQRHYCRALHESLMYWVEMTPARIINRVGAMGSNSSKPYQAQLIREHGFAIPETLITNDPDLVREFVSTHGRVVYKSISGLRSIVQDFSGSDLERLHLIRWCPVQFQAFIDGTNIRVHVVGEEVFATQIRSGATDYRYAHLQVEAGAQLQSVELPEELVQGCVRLAKGLGLAFAGIDLKITPEGRAYCFEVNPCPAFTYYESQTGQPIGNAVARHLAWVD